MNNFHKELLEEIKKHKKEPKNTLYEGDSYVSSGHKYLYVATPEFRKIAKIWAISNKDISMDELILLFDSLIKGLFYEEKTMVGTLLDYLPKQRKEIDPRKYDFWLDYLVGWAEVDSIAQSAFSSKEMLDKWDIWEKLLIKFSKDKNISKRRASLVFLTGPVGQSDDKRLSDLSFKIIDNLKKESTILITKAISWLLRSLIKNHKQEVAEYLEKNLDSLPKIAIRETKRKLLTGKK